MDIFKTSTRSTRNNTQIKVPKKRFKSSATRLLASGFSEAQH